MAFVDTALELDDGTDFVAAVGTGFVASVETGFVAVGLSRGLGRGAFLSLKNYGCCFHLF